MKSKVKATPMFKRYYFRLLGRVAIFLFVFLMYLFKREWFYNLIFNPFIWKISIFHILWAIFMFIMIIHIFPNRLITMAQRKSKQIHFEKKKYDRLELLEYVQDMNRKAWKVLLSWLIIDGVFGALYLAGVIGEVDLWMLVVFYFACDMICIMVYCPFQTHIMHNKCCVNCRIFDWGHFMMFSPTIFMKGFFSWSLFFTACAVLIKWEFTYSSHPERFWSGSNATLDCSKCKDKLCKIKKAYIPKRFNSWDDVTDDKEIES